MALFLPLWHTFVTHIGVGSRRLPVTTIFRGDGLHSMVFFSPPLSFFCLPFCFRACCVVCWEAEHLEDFATSVRRLISVSPTVIASL